MELAADQRRVRAPRALDRNIVQDLPRPFLDGDRERDERGAAGSST